MCSRCRYIVIAVKKTEQFGHVIFLRLVEDQCNSLLPVYIGETLFGDSQCP